MIGENSNQTPVPNPRQWLYVSDLDGTLLNSKCTLSVQAIKRLNHLIAKGIKFTIATARDYDSAYPLLRDLNLKIPVVLLNGAYLMEFSTGKNIDLSNFIPPAIVKEIFSLTEKSVTDFFMFTFEENPQVLYQGITNPASQSLLDSFGRDGMLGKASQREFKTGEELSGIILIDTPMSLEPIYRTLCRKHKGNLNISFSEDVITSGFYWLKIFHKYADKGSIVKLLASNLNIPLSNVMVFGDYFNDLSMFEVAGHSIAVSNAQPEVKEAAHEIIGSNDSCAVINYLESLSIC